MPPDQHQISFGSTADVKTTLSEKEEQPTLGQDQQQQHGLPNYGDGSFLSQLPPPRSGPAEATTVLPPDLRALGAGGMPLATSAASGADWQALENRMMDALVEEVLGQVKALENERVHNQGPRQANTRTSQCPIIQAYSFI